MSHYIIIGGDSYPGYAKFGVDNPIPVFNPNYSFIRDGKGRSIVQVLAIKLTDCYLLGTSAEIFSDFHDLRAWLMGGEAITGYTNPSGPKNFRFYDSEDNLLFSALTTDYDNSPMYVDIEVSSTDGGWNAHVKFSMTIRAQKAIFVADLGNEGVRDILWQKTTMKSQGGDEITYQVSAVGDTAETYCEDKRPSEDEGIVSEETHVQDFVANSYAITYLLNKKGSGAAGAAGVTAFRETMQGSGGGSPLFYVPVTKFVPTKFVGQLTPFILTYTGELRTTRREGLMYPNRDGLPFKDDADETSVLIAEKKPNGTPAVYQASWMQRFIFPEIADFTQNVAKYRVYWQPGEGFKTFDLAKAIQPNLAGFGIL